MWEFFVAFRYIITKQKDKFISVINTFSILGIGLGVATLIVVMSVMSGYEKELISRILSFNSHISILNLETPDEANKLNARLKKIKGVSSSFVVSETQAMLASNDNMSGILIKGVEKGYIETVTGLPEPVLNEKKESGIVIGIDLARLLHVNIGDSVKIISSKFSESMIGPIPSIITMPVLDTIDLGIQEYNSSVAMIKKDLVLDLYDPDEEDAEDAIMPKEKIEIRLKDPNDIPVIKKQIAQALYDMGASEDVLVLDWQDANKSFAAAIRTERNVMFFILSLIIVIAVFNIISGLVILVKDKSKNIAVLRTMGASRYSIVKIFVISGFSIGFIGTLFGAVLGSLLSLNIENIRRTLEKISGGVIFDPVIYFLTTLPSELSWSQVAYVVCMSLAFSLAATIYPAIKVSNSSPTEVLRYE